MFGRFSLSVRSFCDRSRDVAMATNFGAKFDDLVVRTFIRHTSVSKWITGSQFRFKKILIGNDFCTLRRNLVRFGPVTPEFITCFFTSPRLIYTELLNTQWTVFATSVDKETFVLHCTLLKNCNFWDDNGYNWHIPPNI